MPERDHYIPGVPSWVDTSQPDPEAVLDFYSGLFGWQFESVMPPDAPGSYFMARLRGGDVVIEPFDVMGSGRMAVFTDPEGAAFSVWQAGEHYGARVVNEHGALNFNGLNTRDVDGAKAFYGAVFGWTTLAIDAGEMWTLPGYGDDLERDNPDLRKMIAQMGGPAGFEDVVASINPIPGDQPDTPSQWSVTFGVDDADATARKAAELGGKAIVPPFDAPWSRLTILSDPQGATFIASQFVLENKDLGSGQAAQTRS
jgi:predicted enzyme related to lactoylglutathione lyase